MGRVPNSTSSQKDYYLIRNNDVMSFPNRQAYAKKADMESSTQSNFETMKENMDETVAHVAMKTGLKRWHVVMAIILLVCAVIGLCGWCLWRFFKKKRPKDGKKKKMAKQMGKTMKISWWKMKKKLTSK